MEKNLQINQESPILQKEREVFDKILFDNEDKISFKDPDANQKNNLDSLNALKAELSKVEKIKNSNDQFSDYIDEIHGKSLSKSKRSSIKNITNAHSFTVSAAGVTLVLDTYCLLVLVVVYFFSKESRIYIEEHAINFFLYPSIPLIICALAFIISGVIYISLDYHKYQRKFEQYFREIPNTIEEKKNSIRGTENSIIKDLIKDSLLINLVIDFCVLNEIKTVNSVLLDDNIKTTIKSQVIDGIANDKKDIIINYKNLLNPDSQFNRKIESLNSVRKSVEGLFNSNLAKYSNDESRRLDAVGASERDQKVQKYLNAMREEYKNIGIPSEFMFNGDNISSLYINNKSSFGSNTDYKEFCEFFSAPFSPQQNIGLTSYNKGISPESPPAYNTIKNS